jgi:hypothetical protein
VPDGGAHPASLSPDWPRRQPDSGDDATAAGPAYAGANSSDLLCLPLVFMARLITSKLKGVSAFGPMGQRPMAQVKGLRFDRDDEQEEVDRQSVSLAGLAVTLALVVAGLYVIHQLETKAAVEDCLLADHSNCDIILTSAR